MVERCCCHAKARIGIERDHFARWPDTLFQPTHNGTGTRTDFQTVPAGRQAGRQHTALRPGIEDAPNICRRCNSRASSVA